jgi:hypothetical protein
MGVWSVDLDVLMAIKRMSVRKLIEGNKGSRGRFKIQIVAESKVARLSAGEISLKDM